MAVITSAALSFICQAGHTVARSPAIGWVWGPPWVMGWRANFLFWEPADGRCRRPPLSECFEDQSWQVASTVAGGKYYRRVLMGWDPAWLRLVTLACPGGLTSIRLALEPDAARLKQAWTPDGSSGKWQSGSEGDVDQLIGNESQTPNMSLPRQSGVEDDPTEAADRGGGEKLGPVTMGPVRIMSNRI
ncbi:hypothetical protein F5884DRAFT_873181 [Xylogone sp. PMI_703]|nr:hypothetical protein F5884DRAFT_873181 [Xylogone sp. PMI_703]